VIKTASFFPLQSAKNSPPVITAVLEGLKRFGISSDENSWNADAAIIWSVLWHGKMQANRPLYEHYRSQNKPVIIIDIGTLHRGKTWKVAVNNINALGFYGHQENLDYDRPKKLKIKLEKSAQDNESVLIAVQHRNSEQLVDVNVENWILEKIKKIKTVTDRKIVVRPHPRSPINYSLLPDGVVLQKPAPLANTYDSFDFSSAYHAIINHNSGPGILAALHGTRPVVDKSSLAHPVSVRFEDLENPYDIDRSQWLVEICHTEYTLEELSQGLWVKRLSKAL
jgi:hypothetical protein